MWVERLVKRAPSCGDVSALLSVGQPAGPPLWYLAGIPESQASKTNILAILIDDLRVRDLGCTGSTFYETPNLGDICHDVLRFHIGR